MAIPAPPEIRELLIASITPQNLERGTLWFSENISSIKKARVSNPWWRENSFVIEKDLILKPSDFFRKLIDLGYKRSPTVVGKGLFAARGGVIEVWPVNTERPYLIEFSGNVIEALQEREEKPIEVELPYYRSSTSIERITPGSFVVHVDHGIGIYRGTTAEIRNPKSEIRNKSQIQNPKFQNDFEFRASKLEFSTTENLFFVVEYAPPIQRTQPDILYVPTNQKDRLSPYIGFETPRIHRLGGTLWQNIKRRVKEDAEKLARELVDLYTKRHGIERAPYEGDQTLEKELKESFSFEETPDQLRAEEEIMKDLSRPQPMDRILCGDVGFGKTELALRAALRVVSSGKQVALLAPTTILAAQHEKTFIERFKNIPVNIAMLSRLTPLKDEKLTLKELYEGKVDCIIGTHRLLSKDITFKNLGMVIIDEEQRFGVRQKEKFKELRIETDILSLSATPIPRTLSLALAKLRDLSIIETPPPERMPINTLVLPYSEKTIARAIVFEIQRGGQVYFLHNRIETIGEAKKKIYKALGGKEVGLPTGSPTSQNFEIGVIHGRMKEREIIRTMNQFRNREINVLLATTIIENGLDISSANTLIVEDATRLGLAEAHQLRGRIGRGATQAFAYFLYKPKHLTPKAAERLEALKAYSELGAGYKIALRDLEIRGAGNILGREQSGAINKVGLNLYCQMLAESVEHKKMPHWSSADI